MGDEDCLVVRSVYLLPTQDERLRELAFVLKISKGELIRRLIDIGLSHEEELLYER